MQNRKAKIAIRVAHICLTLFLGGYAFARIVEDQRQKRSTWAVYGALRNISAAADQCFLDHPEKDLVTYKELVVVYQYFRNIPPAMGEDYDDIVIHRSSRLIAVETQYGTGIVIRR
jgi:hypothetical protein